jgi:hypothetical protein
MQTRTHNKQHTHTGKNTQARTHRHMGVGPCSNTTRTRNSPHAPPPLTRLTNQTSHERNTKHHTLYPPPTLLPPSVRQSSLFSSAEMEEWPPGDCVVFFSRRLAMLSLAAPANTVGAGGPRPVLLPAAKPESPEPAPPGGHDSGTTGGALQARWQHARERSRQARQAGNRSRSSQARQPHTGARQRHTECALAHTLTRTCMGLGTGEREGACV